VCDVIRLLGLLFWETKCDVGNCCMELWLQITINFTCPPLKGRLNFSWWVGCGCSV
jgi:hypothetical protein